MDLGINERGESKKRKGPRGVRVLGGVPGMRWGPFAG